MAGRSFADADSSLLTVGPADSGARFQNIQAAVDAALPGDTVLVAAGVYHECISFPRAGEPGRPITLRGLPGRIVTLTAGTELAGDMEEMPGYPGVFRLKGFRLENDPGSIGFWEAGSQLRLSRVGSLAECRRRFASWHYDAGKGELYLRSSGAVPAGSLLYIMEDSARPVINVQKSHIVIEGLQIAFGAHGVLIGQKGVDHVTVRRCRIFCNRGAGIHVTGSHHLLEENELFRNNHYGIQLRYGVDYVSVIGNLACYNGPNSGERTDTSEPTDIGIYSRGSYNLFERNIIDGLHKYAFRNKMGANNTNMFRGNVVKGHIKGGAPPMEKNTLIVRHAGMRFGMYMNRVHATGNEPMEKVDPQGLLAASNLIHPAVHKEDPLFADPAYRDFRLQAGSPWMNRGAWPGSARVIYVDPQRGDDSRDGRSLSRALKTLAAAMNSLYPGYTLYLLPGRYEEPLNLTLSGARPSEPTVIRAYGRSPEVVLAGGVSVENASDIVLEGLTISGGPLHLRGATDVRLTASVISGGGLKISSSSRVFMDRVTFRQLPVAVSLTESPEVSLTNSLLMEADTAIMTDAPSLRGLYTDYNVYSAFSARVDGRLLPDLEAWRRETGAEEHGRILPILLDESSALPAASPLNCLAADYAFVGARPARAADILEITGLQVIALGPETASFIWETPGAATESRLTLMDLNDGSVRCLEPPGTFQIMGEEFDMTFRPSAFFSAARHAGISGLKPGRRYSLLLEVFTPEQTAFNSRTLTFVTPQKNPAPRTFYVSPAGSDEAAGKTPQTAWRTFYRAAAAAGPGDRVLVLPGVYREPLRPRVSGSAAHPVLFESAVPHGAVIDLAGGLPAGIEILNVDYVHVKGFLMRGGNYAAGHNYLISGGRGIRISGCRVEYPEGMSFGRLRLGHGGLVAAAAPELVVEDNVFLCGYVGIGISMSPGAIIRNNTILGEGNYGVVIVPGMAGERYTVRNNLFYRAVMGYKTGSNLWVMNLQPELDADHNLYYIPADHKATIGHLPQAGRMASLEEWRRISGQDAHSLTAYPEFIDPERGDFRLRAGSPGISAADDGGPVGARLGR